MSVIVERRSVTRVPTASTLSARSSRADSESSTSAARLFLRWFMVLCLPVTLATGWSYVGALTATGNLSVFERSVEWLRGHHFGGLVSSTETFYYEHHQPPTGGSLATLPAVVSAATPAATATGPAAIDGIPPLAKAPIAGEGVWKSYGDTSAGSAAMQVAYLRPDSIHGTVLAGVTRIDQSKAKFRLIAGSNEPGHGPWSTGRQVIGGDRTRLLAAFNSAFRVADSNGAFMMDGRKVGTVRTGAASLVVEADGSLNVGMWGRDVSSASGPVAVRQNLDLIVDGGQLVAGLDDNVGNRWGKTVGNKLYVWRSGIGIDAQGRVLYAASDGLTVKTLAALLQRAGAVRAMELDINDSWVSFNVFHHDSTGLINGAKLLDGMKKSATRYLSPDSRDFIAVIARQPLSSS